MTSSIQRDLFINRIRRNVERNGFHTYVICDAVIPRFVYTIGLTAASLPEIVMAGAVYYSDREAYEIVNMTAQRLLSGGSIGGHVSTEHLGGFTLGDVSQAWAQETMLGVFDFFACETCWAHQILPDTPLRTLDTPDMGSQDGPLMDPVWRWINGVEQWTHSVPPSSVVVTDLGFLSGAAALEAARWETREWEVFSRPGPEVSEADARAISLATALGIDPSLSALCQLGVGDAIRRPERDATWETWTLTERGGDEG